MELEFEPREVWVLMEWTKEINLFVAPSLTEEPLLTNASAHPIPKRFFTYSWKAGNTLTDSSRGRAEYEGME